MRIQFLEAFDGWALVRERKPVALKDEAGDKCAMWRQKPDLMAAIKRAGHRVGHDGETILAKRRHSSYEQRSGAGTPHMRRIAAAFNYFDHQYTTDNQGRRIRVWTRDRWCGPEDVRDWLLGNRAVDPSNALEHVSAAVLRFLIDGGYIRKDRAAPYYWITAKAAKKYRLRAVLGCVFPE